ncbi:MAG: tetratricopeptide repeat protein [bacterium]|nr:tetratricopeptide repeat protein [bacterium]
MKKMLVILAFCTLLTTAAPYPLYAQEPAAKAGEVITVSADTYTNTAKYDDLKPYDAYTRGKQACEKGDPQGYALLESSARRGCNHAKIYLAHSLLPDGHKLAQGCRSFVLEGKEWSDADRTERYIKWMSSAADNGSLAACQELRQVYKEGTLVPKDSAKVFKYTKALAQLNDSQAMYDLGARYAQGIGCQKDRQAAVKWMKKAAHTGNADAKQWIADRRVKEIKLNANGISKLGYVKFGDSLSTVKSKNSDLFQGRIPYEMEVKTLSNTSQQVIIRGGFGGGDSYDALVYFLDNDRVVKMISEQGAYMGGSAWRNAYYRLREEVINAGYGSPAMDGTNTCKWNNKGVSIQLDYTKSSGNVEVKLEMKAGKLKQSPKIGGWEDLLK